MTKKQYTVTRQGEIRTGDGRVRRFYSGVYAAAIGIKARPQTVYDYLNGRTSALGPKKRAMLVVVDGIAEKAS